MRIGHGFDVHRFCEKFDVSKPLILAGVKLPDEKSLVAHSDGDVILHAVCDAILGAVGAGDIGQHFPDDDAKFAGIASSILLKQVLGILDSKQFWLVNVDITVVAQVPKLAAYRANMISSLANILELPENRVNLKATTTEGLGYIGREEGIACHAVVLLGGDA
ncbi:MAG: 2-C-methyl-D-erythritol 2,4-cyclodiphosphate synthase [SAR86 cluster bacterium]|uniref:2-C-methyl-D-erythritol 2,4-cyclodiphosphate synthase n=1 Tax=SAR86 cluster bacterium TaxID=2030880 RepID=A0A2A5B526_9GAMM|nr:MAG: 2-C-methyl-D-erythritol 2,4-cyclodiphosphate synthase [SAR86 cluster bacterium]